MLAELTPLAAARALAPAEVAAAMRALLHPAVPDETKAAFLHAWSERGETAEELAACAETILPMARDPGVRGSWRGKALLDCSGTGGGGLPLINFSTGLIFVLAAIGVPVVKHGNRGLTKKSGSADVLEALGVRIDLPPEKTEACLEEVGGAFLFAPAYHPSFAAVAPVRRRLGAEGKRTVFNLLGPLLNPARPDARLVGVFRKENVALYEKALRQMKSPHFTVVYGEDETSGKALGEFSVSGPNFIHGTRREGNLPARDLPHGSESIDTLFVADAKESAARLVAILRNEETGLARAMLLANAALAALTQGAASSWEEATRKCTTALDSGAALAVLEKWRKFSARLK